MAVLLSRASSNLTTSTTWGLVDATSYNNSESATTVLTTSYTASSGSTTGVITVDGVALKLSVRTGTTGTMSVHLAIAGVEVTGTLVTINTADLPVAATADLNGGWHFFKFASPVTLSAATSYTVEAKTSSSSQISLRSTSGTNWARALVTTTNQAPAAGDDLIICGEYTGAGTSNSFTVTMDSTAATDYGAASTSIVLPALAICNKGTLSYGTTAATNYILRLSGNLIVYSGGTFNIGTTGTPIPRDSTAILEFDCAVDGDFGLTNRNLGTWNAQGLSRTSGKNVVQCLLNTDEAAAQTVLGVDTDTGWLNNDEIAIASTTRTASQHERRTLSGDAGASTVTVSSGLTNAHSGTSPTQAEVILLTRNVKIRSVSTTAMSWVYLRETSSSDIDWAEFRYIGYNAGSDQGRGISTTITTGTLTMDYCSNYDGEYSAVYVSSSTPPTTGTIAITNCVAYNFSAGFTYFLGGATTGVSNTSMTDTTIIGSSVGIYIWNLGWKTMLRVKTNSSSNAGIQLLSSLIAAAGTSYTYITSHSNGQQGVLFGYASSQVLAYGTVFNNITSWRNNSTGITLNLTCGLTMDTISLFGNNTANFLINGSSFNNVIKSLTANGDSTFSTATGIDVAGLGTQWNGNNIFISYNGGTASGILTAHTTGDINCSNSAGYVDSLFINPILASSTEFANQSNLPALSNAAVTFPNQTGSVRIMNKDNVSGNHYTYLKYGTLSLDSAVYNTAAPSLKMTPSSATFKIWTEFKKAAVVSGGTITCAVYINKNASYNGNQPRLRVRRNDAAGITADTTLATYSAGTGSWNQISGTTAAVSQDAVLEFYVDCDGTAGYISVDDFSVS